jgi:hypothetical protein
MFVKEKKDTIKKLANKFRLHEPLAMTDGQLTYLAHNKKELELAEEESAEIMTRIEERVEQLNRGWKKLCHAQFAYT